jgi:hypothetical protein
MITGNFSTWTYFLRRILNTILYLGGRVFGIRTIISGIPRGLGGVNPPPEIPKF